MGKIYYIESPNSTKLHDYQPIPLQANMQSDCDYHDFVIDMFERYPDIERLILPIKASDKRFCGLTLGLHIRLTQQINKKRLIPLIFTSNEPLSNILLEKRDTVNSPGLLLLTTGVKLAPEDIDNITKWAPKIPAIKEDDFRKTVLSMLMISNPYEAGQHSIANEWGALRLDNCLNLNVLGDKYKDLNKQLYFKYLLSKQHSGLQSPKKPKIPEPSINAQGMNILLIDDEADKGWGKVIENIFHSPKSFKVLKHETGTFEDFRRNAVKEIDKDWDLILLDLRLNPSEEDGINSFEGPEKFSGAQLLKKIKDQNAGTQVIIFTASNKAWNMQYLLQLGADGYFMKESPENNFSEELTLANFDKFKKDIKRCFDNSYLKDLFKRKGKIVEHLTTLMPRSYKLDDIPPEAEFKSKVELHLASLFSFLKDASHDVSSGKRCFEHAFISLFLIIECLIERAIYRTNDEQLKFQCDTPLKNWWRDKSAKHYIEKKDDKFGISMERKVAGLCFQILSIDDPSKPTIVLESAALIMKRNSFIHQKKKAPIEITREDCLKLFDIVNKILTAINKNNLKSLFKYGA